MRRLHRVLVKKWVEAFNVGNVCNSVRGSLVVTLCSKRAFEYLQPLIEVATPSVWNE